MEEHKSANPRVLVVEEDGAVRRFLEVALASRGLETVSAGNGRDGLRIFQQQVDSIDLVLMDVQMAEQDGPATLVQMQKVRPSIPCCFMTGDTSLSRFQELIDCGAKHVFSKPFLSIDELVAKLHAVMAPDQADAGQ